MPRLGDDAGSQGDRHPIANAYSIPNRQLSFGSIVAMIVGVFVLRNILFHDYRSEEMGLLKSSGQTDDQIDNFVPRTASERRAKIKEETEQKAKEFDQIKIDIESLKEEVKHLRSIVDEGKGRKGKTDKGSSTKSER